MNEESIQTKIVRLLRNQFADIVNSDRFYGQFSHLKLYIAREEEFIKTQQSQNLDKNAVYIVIKFGTAVLNYLQTVAPITIIALAEQSNVIPVQDLLTAFSTTYNYNKTANGEISQFYSLPEISSNFNDVFNSYSSVYLMNGSFLICGDSNYNTLTYYYEENGEEKTEEILWLSKSINSDISLDTQPFYNTNNFASSVGSFGTFSFNITSYLMKNKFCEKCIKVAYGELDNVNTKFKIKIEYKNGFTCTREYRLSNYGETVQIGELTGVSLTFAL